MDPLEGKMAKAPDFGKTRGARGPGRTVNPPRARKGGAGNPLSKTAMATADRTVSTKLQRIAELARQEPKIALTSLAHHIDRDWMRIAHRRTRKDGATGIDGQTAKDFEENLEENIQELLELAKSGRYRAPAVRRVHIPKGDGKETRPIGIPTYADKVLQRAVALALEAVYEQDFRDCSYGFRPKRSAHQALEALWQQARGMKGCWILEVDIRKYFDTIDHGHLRAMLQQRVRDGVLLRLIGKWLNAGVMEEYAVSYPEAGTPQGGVISPLLANVYLHVILDVWFEDLIKPLLQGRAFLIRYADDFVMGFECEDDARRVMDVLPKRFGKYGLTIHPTKTRLVDFRRPDRFPRPQGGQKQDGPGTFDLLGFTHYWGRRPRGDWGLWRKTATGRLTRAIKATVQWCRIHRHEPVDTQHRALCAKIRGHYLYYGILGNSKGIQRFVRAVERIWLKWLNRRSQRQSLTWVEYKRLMTRLPFPPPRLTRAATVP